MIAEIPPVEGTMLAFKRAENSWHGHRPFVGVRRVIQFNWVTSEKDQYVTMLRHHASAAVKRAFAALLPGRHSPEPRPSRANRQGTGIPCTAEPKSLRLSWFVQPDG